MGQKRWTVALEHALLIHLQQNWTQQNHDLFRGAMVSPALALHDGRKHLGQWMPTIRTISFSRTWVQTTPWTTVIEVLKHEMAHQYVSEILKVHNEPPHGPAFRSVCAQFHIDSRAQGIPDVVDKKSSKVVDKIQKLLALAQSPNEHEAKLALQKARQWMNEYELAWSQRTREASFSHRCLGPNKGRFDPWEKMLAGLLAKHFFVHAIWIPVYDVFRAKMVRTLEICGRPEAVDVAEYTHVYLTQTAQRLWNAYKSAHGVQSNRERRTFLLGVMMGFSQSLDDDLLVCVENGLVPATDKNCRLVSPSTSKNTTATRAFHPRQPHSVRDKGRDVISIKPAITRRKGLLRQLLG